MADQPCPVAKVANTEKVEAMCALIVGGMTKTKAIEQVFGDGRKFWEAVSGNGALAYRVAQAQEIYADRLVDEALEIVDSDIDPQLAKNRADQRKWTASKLRPKTYGERMELAVSQQISAREAMEESRRRCDPLRVQQWREQGLITDAEIVLDKDTRLPINESLPESAMRAELRAFLDGTN